VDVLGDVFDDAVLNRLATLRGATTAQRERLAVLTARDVLPETDPRSGQLRYWRAKRSAWDVYLTAAAAVGLLDDDLKQRLGGDDDDGFRGAIGECLACWYLTGVPGLKISGRGQGRPGKLPDFHVVTPNGELTAEVKAPYEEPPRNATWSGDASDLVASVIDTANRQFGSDGPNLLILAPSLTFALSDMRYQAIKARSTVSTRSSCPSTSAATNPSTRGPNSSPRGSSSNDGLNRASRGSARSSQLTRSIWTARPWPVTIGRGSSIAP
jgi:hypothetical protein